MGVGNQGGTARRSHERLVPGRTDRNVRQEPTVPYPTVPSQPDLPELERAILERWAADDKIGRAHV